MKISYELRIFSVILLSTSLIFSFSHFGVKAFEGMVLKTIGFSENTFIGSLDVSGLDETEASQQLSAKVAQWKNNTSIQFSYQEVNIPLPLEGITFNVEESVQTAKDSQANDVLAFLEDAALKATLTSLSPSFTQNKVDITKIKQDILVKAISLETGTFDINVENYLIKPISKEQIIQTITVPIQSADLQNIGSSFTLEPKSTFSFLSSLEKQGFSELEPSVLDLLASNIYKLILSSNFQMIERHIGTKLPENISLGYEAKVDPKLNWDLSFYNSNEEAYKIEIYSDGQSLIFDLVGVPFLYQYEILESDLQEFSPKTIKQYSPLLAVGQSTITRNGQKGYYVEVSRLIKDESNSVIEQQLISKDYYAPIHGIEVFALKTAQVSNPDEIPASELVPGDSVIAPSEGSELQDELEPTEEQVDSEENTSEDPLWGKPNENEK
jgi:hypothetical protein